MSFGRSIDDNNIWPLHERNSRYYFQCKDITKCPTAADAAVEGQCICYRDQIVIPREIGEWWQPMSLTTRAYIQHGSECPICLAPMFHKRNAWITCCGHAFHRDCLMKSYNAYMARQDIEHYSNCAPCPICREDLPEFCSGFDADRYNCKNLLDVLENYEYVRDIIQPIFGICEWN